METERQVVIVTGAASGIGRATAVAAAGGGFSVACFDRADAAETVAEIHARGGTARAVAGDVRSGADWAAIVAVAEAIGEIHALANVAGINPTEGDLLSVTDEIWDAVFDINVKGTLNGIRAVVPAMTAGGSGRIVNLSSVAGLRGMAGQAAYSASKAAVAGLTRQAAVELADRGIRVNALAPGVIDTPMAADHPPGVISALVATTPVGRAGAPEEVAAMVGHLIGPWGDFVTGQVLVLDGGWSVKV
jgi:NAD(P)-dependent dehydrogenase (short-subunit alcohol dehydrogenase family)